MSDEMTGVENRICIAIASGDFVPVGFMTSLIMLVAGCERRKVPWGLLGHSGSRITVNRNALVDMAQKSKASHILFIDADMVFEHDVLDKLLAHDKDIVCATACRRNGDGKPIGQFIVGDSPKWVEGGLVEAAMIGMPLMLIKMSVFDNISRPYFAEPVLPGTDYPEGEDIYFIRRVRESGIRVWCDIDISKKLGHIGSKAFYIDTQEGSPASG